MSDPCSRPNCVNYGSLTDFKGRVWCAQHYVAVDPLREVRVETLQMVQGWALEHADLGGDVAYPKLAAWIQAQIKGRPNDAA